MSPSIRLKAQTNVARRKKFDVDRLSIPAVRDNFAAEIRRGLTVTVPPVDIDADWERAANTIYKAGEKIVGFSRVRKRNFVSQQSIDIADAKRAECDNNKRKELTKKLRRSLRKDENSYWSLIAEDMETACRTGNSKSLFSTLKRVLGKKSEVADTILDKNGDAIQDKQRRLPRWTEYFSELLNRPPPRSIDTDLVRAANAHIATQSISLESPTEAEVCKAIRKLKQGKAPGPDQIPAEFYKASVHEIAPELTRIFAKCWGKRTVPKKLQESELRAVYKKGSKNDCRNYRGIMIYTAYIWENSVYNNTE